MEEGKTIFLVDDDTDYLFQLQHTIKKFGFDVITAESQKEAEKKLENFKPDLAIYDLMMENDDSGFILSYKTKSKYPDVPIIIATAVASETGISFDLQSESERKWIKADLYLEKGIRSDQLHREINKLLKI
ncbi:MAG: response regulator [Bacteroidales bacterium]|nr:response regulator [Bacteroidales bacterium]MCF8328581.1 response regulator [Bacteroidales bacterium]